MGSNREITFYYAPQTRALGTLILLEELGASYDLNVLNLKTNQQREPQYLAVNPMGKVPAIRHGDAVITEQVAVFIYLADLYPEAGLAPTIRDPLRGPYLRWLVFYGSCFEPAIIDRSQKREPAPRGMNPYGDFDTMFKVLTDQLSAGPYMLGPKLLAVDVLWATALSWITHFGLVPAVPVIKEYVDRVNARPAFVRARARDTELAAG